MNYKKFSAAASAALTIVIAITLALVSGAAAQSKYKTLYKFKGGKDGSQPRASLILDHAGNLYGTTLTGGASGLGTAFKLTPNADGSWTENVLYSFCSLNGCADGAVPAGTLLFDGEGNLYGTAEMEVFKLTPKSDGTWTESVLHSLSGWIPEGGLIFDHAGNLYGTTGGWGSSGGTVFELTPNVDGTWTERVLYSFCSLTKCGDGSGPGVTLIFDQAGNLYGTTAGGGRYGYGVVFQLTPNSAGSWTENVLRQFTRLGKGGAIPLAGVILDQAGNLYGTTAGGGTYGWGVIFTLTSNRDGSWTEKPMHQFTLGEAGAEPYASMIFDQAGSLYGTTRYGGDLTCNSGGGCGVVFKLAPNSNGGWRETVLHRFSGHPGAQPTASLIFDAAGNLYGTTGGDGSTTFGTVFEITP